jgi:hypothetical protein
VTTKAKMLPEGTEHYEPHFVKQTSLFYSKKEFIQKCTFLNMAANYAV